MDLLELILVELSFDFVDQGVLKVGIVHDG
jgi:hypothetical protein